MWFENLDTRSIVFRMKKKRQIEKWAWLQNFGINSVLDIGANDGEFSEFVTSVFPNAAVYSFEPLESVYSKLVENLKNKPGYKAFNVGLSNINGDMDFFMSSSSPSSSLLPMENLHKELYPFAAGQTKCVVKVARLDDFIRENQIPIGENLLIKMDVQGAENKVIEGGAETFERAKVVLTEVSYFSFYQGQPLARDIMDLLGSQGFVYCGIFEQFYNLKDHLPLFADAFFVKKDILPAILANATKNNQ